MEDFSIAGIMFIGLRELKDFLGEDQSFPYKAYLVPVFYFFMTK